MAAGVRRPRLRRAPRGAVRRPGDPGLAAGAARTCRAGGASSAAAPASGGAVMRRVLRLAGVLVTGAGVVAAGTALRLPALDVSAAGSVGLSEGGALAARTSPVSRAQLV